MSEATQKLIAAVAEQQVIVERFLIFIAEFPALLQQAVREALEAAGVGVGEQAAEQVTPGIAAIARDEQDLILAEQGIRLNTQALEHTLAQWETEEQGDRFLPAAPQDEPTGFETSSGQPAPTETSEEPVTPPHGLIDETAIVEDDDLQF